MAQRSTTSLAQRGTPPTFDTTLLDLVWSMSSAAEDDLGTARAVADLINTGRARLVGNFKGTRHIAV